jgi:hypothetical protein
VTKPGFKAMFFPQDSAKPDGDGAQVPDEKPTAANYDDDSQSKENKPVASQAIPGTPWCIVWTGDEKVFYFNPTTKVSVWEKPEDLLESDKVDEMLEAGPEKKAPSEFITSDITFVNRDVLWKALNREAFSSHVYNFPQFHFTGLILLFQRTKISSKVLKKKLMNLKPKSNGNTTYLY